MGSVAVAATIRWPILSYGMGSEHLVVLITMHHSRSGPSEWTPARTKSLSKARFHRHVKLDIAKLRSGECRAHLHVSELCSHVRLSARVVLDCSPSPPVLHVTLQQYAKSHAIAHDYQEPPPPPPPPPPLEPPPLKPLPPDDEGAAAAKVPVLMVEK